MSNSRIFRFAALLLVAVMALTGCSTSGDTREAMILYDDSNVESNSTEKTYTTEAYLGNIRSEELIKATTGYGMLVTATGYGFEGREFEAFTVKMGDKVQAGDTIATVKSAPETRQISELSTRLSNLQSSYNEGLKQYTSAITAAEADLAKAAPGTAEYDLCEAALSRAKSLKAAYTAAQELSISAVRQQLNVLNEGYTTEIKAPMSGTIRYVASVKAGDTVHDTTELCTIVDTSTYCLRFTGVPAGSFLYGAAVDLWINGGAETVYDAGVIISTPEICDGASGEYVVDVSATYTQEELAKIDTIYVVGSGSTLENVVLVPLGAIKSESGSYYVRVNSDGLISKRYVQVGMQGLDSESGEEVVMISDGLEAGETVVVFEGGEE